MSAVINEGPRLRALGYTRVSTNGQGADGLGMDAQVAAIHQACERRGWELVRVAQDVGSGSRTNGGLRDALAQLAAGEADALVVAKQDRLSRSLVDFAGILEQAQRCGWRLVVLEPDFDLGTSAGRMMAGMLAVFAEYEREQISERTKAALAEARKRGTKLGRPKGTSRIPDDVRERILTERASGASLRTIASGLDADEVPTAAGKAHWSAESVRQVILTA